MYVCSVCGSQSEKDAGLCHGAARSPACEMCGNAKSQCMCWCWVVGKILMILGVVAAIGALITGAYGTKWTWMDSDALFHSAAILLLLGIICARKKRMRHGGCGSCGHH